MKTISIDIETYSSADLGKCGVYKYTEALDFDILLFGYSVDGGPVQVVDLASGEMLPAEIMDALAGVAGRARDDAMTYEDFLTIRDLRLPSVLPQGYDEARQDTLKMALVVFIVVPIACAYPFFQRYVVAGLTVGSVKG